MAECVEKPRVCMSGNVQIHEDSSESEGEAVPVKPFRRRLSVHREIKHAATTKEGYLLKQTWSFQRWRRRYFKLRGHTLYYAKDDKAVIFDEIDITDLSFAECSIKNINNSFQLISPYRRLVLAAESRREMEEWIMALKAANSREYSEDSLPHLWSGHHHWYATSHARPTYCNICREALSGVTSHGLSCEVCKCKVHKKCALKAINNCKWTTLASIGKDIIEDRDGNITMPHQWMEGNLPVSAKCAVCDRTCGSVLRLQDWRCLWCRATVHTACRPSHPVTCPLGPSRVSVVPPTSLYSVGSDDAWEAVRPQGCSPLLVFVNSKSGENQGVKFLRRFKQLLNPAQVFDLISTGPGLGLGLFRHFDPFRILVCSGDGSVGWVLSEIDRLQMHKQCQVGVLPLGTGNDLARVLGWGSSCDHDAHLPQLLERYEKACTKMLDRWSIMTYERNIGPQVDVAATLAATEDSIMIQLNKILEDETSRTSTEIRMLTEAVSDITLRVTELSLEQEDLINAMDDRLKDLIDILEPPPPELIVTSPDMTSVDEKCVLEKQEKDLINTKERTASSSSLNLMAGPSPETLQTCVDNMKSAVRQLVEATERAVANRTRHNSVGDRKRFLNIPGPRRPSDLLKPPPSSGDSSPTSTPGHSFLSISPLPDIRRDSTSSVGGEDLTSIPVPTAFADGRSPGEDTGYSPVLPPIDPNDELAAFMDEAGRLTDTFSLLNVNSHGLSRRKDSVVGSGELGSLASSALDLKVPSHTAIPQSGIESEMLASSDRDRQGVDSSPLEKTVRAKDIVNSLREQEALRDLKLSSLSTAIQIDSNKYSLPDEKSIEGKADVLGFAEECEKSFLLLKSKQEQEGLKSSTQEKRGSFLTVPEFHHGMAEQFPSSREGATASDGEEEEMVLTSSYDPERGGIDSRQPSLGGDFVIKSETTKEDDHKDFPKMISVVVEPPSPEAHPQPKRRVHLDESIFRRYSTGKLSPSYSVSGFARSPAATRRISTCSLLKAHDGPSFTQRSKSLTDTDHRRRLPIINPLVRLPMWPNVSGAGLISKVLLANADFLCAAASPLMDPDESLMEGYFERAVMNNYFGIGIDAKISLDFHQKREEHPEKCRSRAKNYMWYGVLGSKQWLQKTYKNLEQRVQLECDGQRIPLPSLQGIVILNIPSFMGGTNFWGGKKEDDCFLAPSFDDRILEVVAVFGSVQMAASRLINLQHHRIAQCQNIQITILGDEGVPVEVDGEAWIQPPGMIRIIHKNRMQMLCRNRALETSLKTWEEKQKQSISSSLQSVSQVQSTQSEEGLSPFSEDENQLLLSFIESATTLVKYVKLLTISHPIIEPELYQIAAATAAHMEKVHPGGKIVEGPNLRPQVTDLVSSARQLYEETCSLLREKGQQLKMREDLEGKLSLALGSMEMELRKCVTYDSVGLVHFQPMVDDQEGSRRSRSGRGLSWLKFRRSHSSGSRGARDVATWGVTEVVTWLDTLGLAEYGDSFTGHDVRGRELLTLSRRDLKELGVTKVGHVKRILQGVKDLTMKSRGD